MISQLQPAAMCPVDLSCMCSKAAMMQPTSRHVHPKMTILCFGKSPFFAVHYWNTVWDLWIQTWNTAKSSSLGLSPRHRRLWNYLSAGRHKRPKQTRKNATSADQRSFLVRLWFLSHQLAGCDVERRTVR